MRFEKIWVKQCKATKGIKCRYGAKSALDYLIGEKLMTFADEADERAEFARELPRFLAAIWQVFNQYEIAGYVASLKPTDLREPARDTVRTGFEARMAAGSRASTRVGRTSPVFAATSSRVCSDRTRRRKNILVILPLQTDRGAYR
jgi:hypothetical protein